MNVHADLSFLTLILNASVIVQAIIALLALLSMWSWWQIFLKMFQLRRILRETDAFEDEFWQGGKTSHCGIDVFELAKENGRWRIGNMMWTVEPDACATLRPADASRIRPKP